MASRFSYFKEVWAETFPDPDRAVADRMAHRRKMAKMQKEAEALEESMTPEELEAQEAATPEWKRGALVVTDEVVEEDQPGMFGRLKNKVSSKIANTEAGKKFKESEEYEKLKAVRANYDEFKGTLKEGVENTQNPVIQRAVATADIAYTETSCAKAIKNMQAYDPYFDFDDLEIEATEIFKEFYCNFLSGNLEYLETVSAGPALAVCKADITNRKKEHWEYAYHEMLDCGKAVFNGGQMDQVPSFTYIVSTQEIDCKICTKKDTAGDIKSGGDDNIMGNSWRITISRHQEPDIEVTGHYWEVTELQKVGEMKQLV